MNEIEQEYWWTPKATREANLAWLRAKHTGQMSRVAEWADEVGTEHLDEYARRPYELLAEFELWLESHGA